MKKVIIALSALVLLSAFADHSKKPTTFEQDITDSYYAFLDFIDTDINNPNYDSKLAIAQQKNDYLDTQWDVDSELESRKPKEGFVCSVLAFISWRECEASASSYVMHHMCQVAAQNTMRDCSRMWPFLPTP
jgi:hypothetical protein